VELRPGLNVVTGESGSGKSVLLEALSALLGAPLGVDCVRPPAKSALVEAHFQLDAAAAAAARAVLAANGLPEKALPPAGAAACTLVVRREVFSLAAGARSRCQVNGSTASVRVLRDLGAALVDASGQHAALSLRDAGTQLRLLDVVAGTLLRAGQLRELQAQAAEVRAAALACSGCRYVRRQKVSYPLTPPQTRHVD